MEIVSYQFLLFSIIVLAVYYCLSRSGQNIWLLITSYVFYFTWSPSYTIILAAVTIINFLLAKHMASSKNRKSQFIIGLLINGAPFILIKILSGPYGQTLFNLTRMELEQGWLTSTLLPIGLSFYILQAISYLVDVYQKRIPPCSNFIDFALYLSYFPKLLAGPIERAPRFIPILQNDRCVDNRRFGHGLGLIIVGWLRKIIIADSLMRALPADIFAHPEKYTSAECLVWLVIFSFGLYNDFAGYTSIVRGFSDLMGIELSPNFRAPFFARSISDFWNRWHISLSQWLRDYIFFPLRRWFVKRRSSVILGLILPSLMTMFVSGFWHGVYMSMFVWGTLYGLYLALEQIAREYFPRSRQRGLPRTPLAGIWVFFLVTLTWIPFKASSLGTAIQYFGKLIPPFSFHLSPKFLLALFPISLSLFIDWLEEKQGNNAFFVNWKSTSQAVGIALSLVIMVIFLLTVTGTAAIVPAFIYQGF